MTIPLIHANLMEASPSPFGYDGMNVTLKHVIKEEHILHIDPLHHCGNYEDGVSCNRFKQRNYKDTHYSWGMSV